MAVWYFTWTKNLDAEECFWMREHTVPWSRRILRNTERSFEDRLSRSEASEEPVDKRRSMKDYGCYRQLKSRRHKLTGGVDAEELDSNVDDWEEETIELCFYQRRNHSPWRSDSWLTISIVSQELLRFYKDLKIEGNEGTLFCFVFHFFFPSCDS